MNCCCYVKVFVVLSVDSAEVRSPRPPYIKFRVGQVVRHKRFGYRGVIIGWDAVAKVSRSTVTLLPRTIFVHC